MGTKKENKKSPRVDKGPGLIKTAFSGLAKGDWAVKSSAVVMGMGYFGRKQYVKGVIVTIYQIVMLLLIFMKGLPYLMKFNTLGTVKREYYIDPDTYETVTNNYDNSFSILLFSVVTI